MSKYTGHEETTAVLATISSFLEAMGRPAPLKDARKLILESGFYFLASSLHGNMSFTLGQSVDVAEKRKDEGKAEAGEYRLAKTDSAAEVYVHDQIAAVWAAIERVTPTGSIGFRSHATFTLIKPDDADGWKISGFAHSHPADADAALPPVSAEMTPEVDRLMHFAELVFESRGCDSLSDWAVPGAQMVAHRLPSPPIAAPLADMVQQMTAGLAKLPADAKWREDFEDLTLRTAGDMGFIWTHFATFIDGKPQSTGIDVLMIHRQENRWLFSATQTLSIKSTVAG